MEGKDSANHPFRARSQRPAGEDAYASTTKLIAFLPERSAVIKPTVWRGRKVSRTKWDFPEATEHVQSLVGADVGAVEKHILRACRRAIPRRALAPLYGILRPVELRRGAGGWCLEV